MLIRKKKRHQKKIQLLTDEVDNHIKVKGKITSKLHVSTIVDSEYYHFRLSCKIIKDNTMDFSVYCYNKDLIENLAYEDTVVVDGYFTDIIYQNKKKNTLKILRTIYCDSIKKIVDNK